MWTLIWITVSARSYPRAYPSTGTRNNNDLAGLGELFLGEVNGRIYTTS